VLVRAGERADAEQAGHKQRRAARGGRDQRRDADAEDGRAARHGALIDLLA
jgi:hypothetical protein